MSDQLTQQERQSVRRYLHNPEGIGVYGYAAAVMGPSLLMMIYGLFKMEPIVLVIAYVALFAIVVWYLIYSEKLSKPLLTALQKYEDRCSLLRESGGDAT